MPITKEILATIRWTKMCVVTDEGNPLLVLECETHQQAIDFLHLLNDNKFELSFKDSDKGLPALVITFIEDQLDLFIVPSADILFKYLTTNKVKILTTGFQHEKLNDVAYLNGRIKMNELHYSKLN